MSASGRALTAYYLATPLFAALDLGLSIPIRAVGVESPSARLAYYAATFALGLVMWARPKVEPWLAMGESSVNLTLLMLAVLVPIWSLGETLDAGSLPDLPSRIANLALSGSVLLYSFYRSQARAVEQVHPGRKPG